MAGIFLIAVVIIGAVGFYSLYYLPESQKDKVEDALRLHIEYYNTRNIDGYYDQVSQYSKDMYDITLGDIIDLLNTADFEGRNVTLISVSNVEVRGDVANIKGVVMIRDNRGSQSGEINHTYRLERGEWKYDLVIRR